MKLGSKFRKIRISKDLPGKYVAHLLGMSQENYSKYELDKIKPTWDFIVRFAAIHDADPFKIVSREEDASQQSGNNADSTVQEQNDKLLDTKDNLLKAKEEIIRAKEKVIQMKEELIKFKEEVIQAKDNNIRVLMAENNRLKELLELQPVIL